MNAKAIKQNLKVKTFVSISENALHIHQRPRGSLALRPVTPEVAGSSPVGPANAAHAALLRDNFSWRYAPQSAAPSAPA